MNLFRIEQAPDKAEVSYPAMNSLFQTELCWIGI